jgi:predicted nuclease of predicted toxin-antitoxin system
VKFKLDENLPAEVADDLRSVGHDAETVHTEGLTGASDPVVAAAARAEQRVLLTMDKGLADVRAYPPGQHAGIVLLRLRTAGRTATREFLREHLADILRHDLSGRLVIVTERGIRTR